MKRTIVLLSAVLLMSAVATATTNLEGFEGYALTTDWGTGENGWNITKMYGVEDSQVARIVDDGGNQILDLHLPNSFYGLQGYPLWDGSVPDNAAYVTKSGFDFKPISGSAGSEFHMRIDRADVAEPWYHSTWEVGVRVSKWAEFSTPVSPYMDGASWDSTGTYVYLRTWVGPGEVYTETEIPGFGLGSFLVPGIPLAPPETTSEWYTMEIEEDNVLNKSRARMYLKGGTPNAWTAWQDHAASSDYSTGGILGGFRGGSMQFDNVYVTPEPATMLLLGAGSLLLIRRRRR